MPPCPFDTEINKSSLKSSFQRIQRTLQPALSFSRFLGCGRLSLNVGHHKGCFLKTQTLTTVAQQKGQNRRKSAKKTANGREFKKRLRLCGRSIVVAVPVDP